MAGTDGRRGFFGRLASLASGGPPVGSNVAPTPGGTQDIGHSASVAMIDASVPPPSENGQKGSNGNGNGRHRFLGQKAVGDLLPRLNGIDADFFSPDSGNTIIPIAGIGSTGLALVAYWYCATRWRAQKIAEAPLMVVAEDQTDGSEEWLPDHELAEVLDDPSPDYDMGELMERTSRYLDNGGEALWVKDRDRAQRVARLTPFARGEFSHVKVPGRLYGRFRVTTSTGPREFDAEDVCYFPDFADGWTSGRSRLEVAMAWLNLGDTARSTIRDLLENSVWPSLVAIPDKDWNPDDDALAKYQQELNAYGQRGKKGRAFAALGGGSVLQLVARIRDLVPEELLNRVESVVSAVSGVPAIVLQFQVGMENSPWSQMEQARAMAYDDTIQPSWRRIERVLTRQLLRPDDDDRTHFVRFDKSNIAALQIDRVQATAIAVAMGKAATLNERRVVMGLEPSDDPRADEIPELAAPVPPPIAAAVDPNADTGGATNGTSNTKAARRRSVAVMSRAFRQEARDHWENAALRLLRQDANEIERIVKAALDTRKVAPRVLRSERKDETAPDLRRVMADIDAYLRQSKDRWGDVAVHLTTQGAERAAAVAAADLGIGFNQLHSHVVAFAKREAAALVTNILATTREAVANAIVKGLEAADDAATIARAVAEAGAFAPSRALLIAQTESTKASAGGPTEAIQAFARASGRTFVKRWSGKLDERERDSHIALEGETRFIDDQFSNGLQFPGDPSGDPAESINCRCELVLSEVADA